MVDIFRNLKEEHLWDSIQSNPFYSSMKAHSLMQKIVLWGFFQMLDLFSPTRTYVLRSRFYQHSSQMTISSKIINRKVNRNGKPT